MKNGLNALRSVAWIFCSQRKQNLAQKELGEKLLKTMLDLNRRGSKNLRIVNFINCSKFLVLAPVFRVASTAAYHQYATVDTPCLILNKTGEHKPGAIMGN